MNKRRVIFSGIPKRTYKIRSSCGKAVICENCNVYVREDQGQCYKCGALFYQKVKKFS